METEKNSNTAVDQMPDKESIIVRGEIEKVGGPIELEKARKWNQNYRRINSKDTTSHMFGREVFEKLLRQKDCQGIRIHYCLDDMGKKQLILSGVDHFGNDQLPHKTQTLKANAEYEGLNAAADDLNDDNQLYDQSWPCPGTKGCPSNDLTHS